MSLGSSWHTGASRTSRTVLVLSAMLLPSSEPALSGCPSPPPPPPCPPAAGPGEGAGRVPAAPRRWEDWATGVLRQCCRPGASPGWAPGRGAPTLREE